MENSKLTAKLSLATLKLKDIDKEALLQRKVEEDRPIVQIVRRAVEVDNRKWRRKKDKRKK